MESNLDKIPLVLTEELIKFPSLSGQELEVLNYLCSVFKEYGWTYETIPVEKDRYNIFVTFGEPHVCFTTHIDVVPAPEELFKPEVREGKIFGRGACDAKGIFACMIAAVKKLEEQGASNMSLLLVVGEETDGIGAKTATKALKNRNIRYLVNGEPTEGKLVTAHKGGLGFRITTTGVSCHSGYPDLGVDANKKLIEIAYKIQMASFGEDALLGPATINLGVIKAGTASNIVSDRGQIQGMVRTVTDSETVIEILKNCIDGNGELEILNNAPKVTLKTVAGFELTAVSYATDIPHFLPLGAECLMYGPGSIQQAHTDNEWVEIAALEKAVEAYTQIYYELIK